MASIRKDTTCPSRRNRIRRNRMLYLSLSGGTLALACATASSFTLGFQSCAVGPASSLRTSFFGLGVGWPVPTHVRKQSVEGLPSPTHGKHSLGLTLESTDEGGQGFSNFVLEPKTKFLFCPLMLTGFTLMAAEKSQRT